MGLSLPMCNRPECQVVLQERAAMARRGERSVSYTAKVWRCEQCADPDTGQPPLEFQDAQLMAVNEAALAAAWTARYDEAVPPSGRPGRRTEAEGTQRVAMLLTLDELERVDARRGGLSRSEFLRGVIAAHLGGPSRAV